MPFKAVRADKTEAGQDVRFATMEEADLMDGDVVVRVSQSTVNYKDGLALSGKSAVIRRFPMVLGIDLAGVVERSSHPGFAPGDEVIVNGYGLSETHFGGYAEKARLKGEWLVKLPAGLSRSEAMAIGTAGSATATRPPILGSGATFQALVQAYNAPRQYRRKLSPVPIDLPDYDAEQLERDTLRGFNGYAGGLHEYRVKLDENGLLAGLHAAGARGAAEWELVTAQMRRDYYDWIKSNSPGRSQLCRRRRKTAELLREPCGSPPSFSPRSSRRRRSAPRARRRDAISTLSAAARGSTNSTSPKAIRSPRSTWPLRDTLDDEVGGPKDLVGRVDGRDRGVVAYPCVPRWREGPVGEHKPGRGLESAPQPEPEEE